MKLHKAKDLWQFRLDTAAAQLFHPDCTGKLVRADYIRVFPVGAFDLVGDVEAALERVNRFIDGITDSNGDLK